MTDDHPWTPQDGDRRGTYGGETAVDKAQWIKVLKGVVCHHCGTDQIMDVAVNELGEASVTCEDGHVSRHAAPLPAAESADGRLGMLEDLGAYATLMDLFVDATAPYREHGIIEHLFAAADPDAYRELVQQYGHTSFGPRRYSASVMIARALGQLSRLGQLAYQRHKGTGYWAYNSDIGYWALAPGPDPERRQTWASFAQANGISAEDWPATGYVHGAAPGVST